MFNHANIVKLFEGKYESISMKSRQIFGIYYLCGPKNMVTFNKMYYEV